MSAPARIGEHGVIGDMRTAALVAQTGEIDSMCFPFFDSPPIFDRLIDPIDGGAFQIVCNIDDAVSHQLYLPNTNVLITRALGSGGILEITDFMALGEDVPQCLVRRVAVVRGEVEVHIRCRPRFDYGRVGHDVAVDGHAVHFAPADHGEGIRLCCPTADWTGKDGAAEATLRLRQGERADLVLSRLRDEHADLPLRGDRLDRVFHRTVEAWRRWVARSRYTGRWREEVSRSGLLLKLLTSKANGSLVAAPTFGLPEAIGGQRNWDYRFTWVRDASLGLLEFLALGHTEEAAAFVTWLTERCAHAGEEGRLEPMYRLNGGAVPDEQSLEHYEGYRGSRPVRIGNGAAGQLQLDTYGELFLALDRYDAATAAITHDDWRYLRSLVAWLRDNWSREDKSIWEIRGDRREFLYSRVMSWTALDRAHAMATRGSRPGPIDDWRKIRDVIYEDVHERFFDAERRAFVQHVGTSDVDASALLMPQVGFIGGRDPRWLSTLDAIDRDLAEDALVFRYRRNRDLDPFESTEGSFSVCSFWFVDCLARAGQVDRARLLFDKMLGYANEVGLYAEQLGPTGEQLGNFPQALTHIGLIEAARSLDAALDAHRTPH